MYFYARLAQSGAQMTFARAFGLECTTPTRWDTDEIVVERDLMVSAHDGVLLATDSTRQVGRSRFRPVLCRAPLRVVWGCRFSAAPDLAMLVVASRQLRQALA